VLVVDKTNDRVGVNTAAPAYDLEVTGYIRNLSGQIFGAFAATDTAPSFSFSNDTGTGMYRSAANVLGFSAGGTERLSVGSTLITKTEPMQGEDGSVTAPTYGFTSDTDTGIFLAAAGDMRVTVAGGSVSRWNTAYFGPVTASGTYNCGASGARWGTYYGTNADDISSDERLKVNEGDSLGLEFLQTLTPFAGRWRDDSKGTEKHQWLSAQNVAHGLDLVGEDAGDSALWHEDDNGHQSLAYTELIPVLISAVKELAAELAELKGSTP